MAFTIDCFGADLNQLNESCFVDFCNQRLESLHKDWFAEDEVLGKLCPGSIVIALAHSMAPLFKALHHMELPKERNIVKNHTLDTIFDELFLADEVCQFIPGLSHFQKAVLRKHYITRFNNSRVFSLFKNHSLSIIQTFCL